MSGRMTLEKLTDIARLFRAGLKMKVLNNGQVEVYNDKYTITVRERKKMTENEFWDNVGRFAEISDTACENCVVDRYRRKGHVVNCGRGCTNAIRHVYECIKGHATNTNTGGREGHDDGRE